MVSKTSEPFSVAIVGCGLIGNKRAQVLAADPESRLCTVADPDIVCAEALWAKFCDIDDGKRDPVHLDKSDGGTGAPSAHDRVDAEEGHKGLASPAVCADWRETLALEKSDAVIIATPNKFSAMIATEAADLGMHVLCEKPLGRNVHEARELVEAAIAKHVVLKTGFNHRHHPAIHKAHELTVSGAIGPVYFIRCVYGHGYPHHVTQRGNYRQTVFAETADYDQYVEVHDQFGPLVKQVVEFMNENRIQAFTFSFEFTIIKALC